MKKKMVELRMFRNELELIAVSFNVSFVCTLFGFRFSHYYGNLKNYEFLLPAITVSVMRMNKGKFEPVQRL